MKLFANKFMSGGLHENHLVATWLLGTFSALAYRHRETEKNQCRGGRSQQFVCFLRLCSRVVGSYGLLNKVLYKISLYDGENIWAK